MSPEPNLVAYCKRIGHRTAVILNFEPDKVPAPPRHRIANPRCRSVCVVGVDEHEAAHHQPPFGKAKPVHVGKVFPSAAIASEHLGYSCNAVALKFGTQREYARRAGKLADPEVVLRGVTLAYAERKV